MVVVCARLQEAGAGGGDLQRRAAGGAADGDRAVGLQALAGGGRYDRLFGALGVQGKVDAIGCEFRPDLISLRLRG